MKGDRDEEEDGWNYAPVGQPEGARGRDATLTNSVSGQILGEWVDKRVGGRVHQAAAQLERDDAENLMTDWATLAAERLSSWTSGAVKPS